MNDTDFVNADGTVRSWLGQYAAWQNIGCDSDLIDSSAIMDTFISLASNSRYAYIANIENDIINGDFVTANALIATPPAPLVGSGQYYDSTTGVTIVDDSTNNYIVDNYRMFYSTYINYITGVMTCTDSGNVKYMANLCPSLYGTVVYQSRSLFTAVFNQLRVWNDDSCFVSPDSSACQCGQNGRRGKIKQYNNNDAKNAQKFALLPNPNSGNFTLRQLLTDTKPVDIQIWNAIGQTIYKQQVVFIGKEYKVDIGNMQKGIYMLQLLDANGHSFTYKFAIK